MNHPQLFKLNKITNEERLVNLCALLSGTNSSSEGVVLPSNSDAAIILNSSLNNTSSSENVDGIKIDSNYITLFTEGNANTWYLATCTGQNQDGTYEMDHLQRVDKKSNLKWKHPANPDIENIKPESIFDCQITGDWDVYIK